MLNCILQQIILNLIFHSASQHEGLPTLLKIPRGTPLPTAEQTASEDEQEERGVCPDRGGSAVHPTQQPVHFVVIKNCPSTHLTSHLSIDPKCWGA